MSRIESTVEFGVAIPRKAADVISEKYSAQLPGAGPPVLLSRVAASMLKDLAAGGMMLDPTLAKRIEEVLPNAEPSDIADAIDKAKDRRYGQASYMLELDPTFLGPLEEVARAQGLDVRQTIQEGVNHIFSNGWLYQLPNDFFSTRFDPQDYAMICEVMGEGDFTGTSLAEWIRRKFVMGGEETQPEVAAAVPIPEEEEDELIFQGTK